MTDLLQLREHALEWREIDGEIVALETDRSVYLAANGAGSILWQLLVPGATHEELVTALCKRWPIQRDRAGRDVDAFLAEIRAQDLLR
jgi:hypothetical protein